MANMAAPVAPGSLWHLHPNGTRVPPNVIHWHSEASNVDGASQAPRESDAN